MEVSIQYFSSCVIVYIGDCFPFSFSICDNILLNITYICHMVAYLWVVSSLTYYSFWADYSKLLTYFPALLGLWCILFFFSTRQVCIQSNDCEFNRIWLDRLVWVKSNLNMPQKMQASISVSSYFCNFFLLVSQMSPCCACRRSWIVWEKRLWINN